jgi:hypothetical protein
LAGEALYPCGRIQALNRPGWNPIAHFCPRSFLVVANPQDFRGVHSWLTQQSAESARTLEFIQWDIHSYSRWIATTFDMMQWIGAKKEEAPTA